MTSCNSLESVRTENSVQIMCAKHECEKSPIKFFNTSTLGNEREKSTHTTFGSFGPLHSTVSAENSARIMCAKPEWGKSLRFFKSLNPENEREATRSAANIITACHSLHSMFSFGYPKEGDHKQLRPFGSVASESPHSIYLRRQRYVRSYAFKKRDSNSPIFETVLEKAKTWFKEKKKGNCKDVKARSGKTINSCCSNYFNDCFKLLSGCTVQVDVLSSPKKKVDVFFTDPPRA